MGLLLRGIWILVGIACFVFFIHHAGEVAGWILDVKDAAVEFVTTLAHG